MEACNTSSVKYDYAVQVYDGATWTTLSPAPSSVTTVDDYHFENTPTAQFTVSNNRAVAAKLCRVGRLCKILRNGVMIFYGKIMKVQPSNSASQRQLVVSLESYWHRLLIEKQTGNPTMWTLDSYPPDKLIKAMIGTMFLVQDTFDTRYRIDTLSGLNMQNSCLCINKGASGYLPSGSATSTIMQNGPWDTMGNITSVEVRVYPSSAYTNTAPNNDFEDDMTLTDGSITQGYYVYNGTPASWEISQDATTYYSGSRSLKFVHEVSGSGSLSLQQRNWRHDCEPGQTWEASMYVKGTGGCFIRIWYETYTGSSSLVMQSATATDTWTKITAKGVLPANTRGVNFDFGALTPLGTCYIDKIYFGRVPGNNDIRVQVSNDGGCTFVDANMTYCDGG